MCVLGTRYSKHNITVESHPPLTLRAYFLLLTLTLTFPAHPIQYSCITSMYIAYGVCMLHSYVYIGYSLFKA